jgi:anthranilate phosphoribosyltransferase
MIRECIQKLVDSNNLSGEESEKVMSEIMSGSASNAQIAAFLTAMRLKGETVEELSAFANVMRVNCIQIHPNINGRLVDTCGTGGDKLKTFNISTTAAFVVAGAGIAIAKHGNRSVTSRSGSADVLEKLGVNLNMEPKTVEYSVEQIGIGFLFAPVFHPAMKYAAAPRKEIGIRTIFNLLGPLTNPANATAQLLGVYDAKLTVPLAYALKRLGCIDAMVSYGLNGLDEISTLGKTIISRLKDGEVTKKETSPKDFGVKQARIENLKGGTPEENAKVLFQILSGNISKNDPKKEIVLVNAAAGVIVGGKAESFREGIEIARKSIESGQAYKKLKMLIRSSGGDSSKLEEFELRHD